jgi:hypothetical protein
MKRLLIVVTLVCILSGTALAGDMPGGGAPLIGDMPGGGKLVAETPCDGISIACETPCDDGSAISDETESGSITTLLVTLFLLGR